MTDQLSEDQILKDKKPINILPKCSFPDCISKKADSMVLVNLANSDDESVNLPFCRYHAYIVLGGQFVAYKKGYRVDGTPCEPTYTLDGDVKTVQLIESVMAAREMVKNNK